MKNFIKKQLANLNEWFLASNRWVHLMTGWAITLVTAIIIGLPMGAEPNVTSMFLGAYVATLVAMVGLEVKDKMKGGKFDWKDLNAGMFLANVFLIVWAVWMLCK